MTKHCKYCGTEFKTKSHSRQICGSRECYLRQRRDAHAARNPKPKPRRCKCCGREFQPKHKFQVYCSLKVCQRKRGIDQRNGEVEPRATFRCVDCKGTFEMLRVLIEKENRCSGCGKAHRVKKANFKRKLKRDRKYYEARGYSLVMTKERSDG